MKPSTLRGLIVIGAALSAAMTTWSLARAAGLELELKANASMDTVRAVDVAVAVLVAGFAAWGVHTLLHRAGRARWWPPIGSSVLAISMIGPSYYADGETALVLTALHFIAGVVLIAGLALATAGSWRCAAGLERSPHTG